MTNFDFHKSDSCTHLLALAYPPPDGRSILNWVPFQGGDQLYEIIETYNKKCLAHYLNMGWIPESIEEQGDWIIVVPHDLSDIDTVRREDFAKIYFLLIGLDHVEGQESAFERVKARMIPHRHKYYISQASTKEQSTSCLSKFLSVPFSPSNPAIISHQKDFENWLENLHGIYAYALGVANFSQSLPKTQISFKDIKAVGVLPSTVDFEGGERFDFDNNIILREEYFKAIPKISLKIRDSIIESDLPIEEMSIEEMSGTIKDLAYREVSKELSSIQISESIRTLDRPNVNTEKIFEPSEEARAALAQVTSNVIDEGKITLTPEWQPVDLVEVYLSGRVKEMSLGQLKREMNKEQFSALRDLGIKGKSHSVLLWNHQTTWDKLSAIDNLVETQERISCLPMRSILGNSNFSSLSSSTLNLGSSNDNFGGIKF
ncbi:MAG: hypothetical protein ACTS2F_19670 [Thainema sp.]